MELRVARHTNDLEPLITFYTQLFDFSILGTFQNHDNYDGVFLGKQNLNWHLEFTKSLEHINHQFREDDLLVFYPKTADEYQQLLKNIEHYNIPQLIPKNPYWEHNGIMITDPDGYPIVVSDLRVS